MFVERKEFQGHYYHVGHQGDIVWGFTERGFPMALFSRLFPGIQVRYLQQIHSNIIINSSQIEADSQGDGIIIDEPKTLALIKTADCVPLFFWHPDHAFAGILHIGWRGLMQAIQTALLQIIRERGMAIKNLRFFIGPAIEGNCYEVGPELHETFVTFAGRDQFFTPLANGRYHLNLIKGISLSLQAQGIKKSNITDIDICTKCNWHNFPSYRKNGKTGERIFNFLMVNK